MNVAGFWKGGFAMVRKKVEGDEAQRRAAARAARRSGQAPSAWGQTTGASKQRTHLPGRHALAHEDKLGYADRGKQGEPVVTEAPARQQPGHDFRGRGAPDYGEAHERVFRAVAQAEEEHGADGVYLEDISRAAGMPVGETRALLHDLVAVHRLVTELSGADDPDLGPRYETKPRL